MFLYLYQQDLLILCVLLIVALVEQLSKRHSMRRSNSVTQEQMEALREDPHDIFLPFGLEANEQSFQRLLASGRISSLKNHL